MKVTQTAHLLWLLIPLLLPGCASFYKPQNQAIQTIANGKGYRYSPDGKVDRGDHLVMLAFSGGGTRAAALSYGVLQELRDTQLQSEGKRVRLLDEVDSISSVSGGSFTAAYYGLFGDEIFTDYEKVFLRQSIQGTLIRQLFNPVYWWKALFSGFDRTEMAVEYYDSHIFRGKTFADIPSNQRAFIEINATDLGIGQRFSFVQAMFDLICSDLEKFSVARAVTASSAVPVAFPPVALKNHSGECNAHEASIVRNLQSKTELSERQKDLRDRIQSYLDAQARPYIHLVDGGIVDNLGLRALLDRLHAAGSEIIVSNKAHVPKDLLVVLVNAEVKPERTIDQSASKPSVMQTVDAFSNAQIALYNRETRIQMEEEIKKTEEELRAKGYDIHFYLAEVSFESVQSQSLKSYFNNLPTSLELSDEDVDTLIKAGRDLLRRDKQYQTFLETNSGI